MPSTMANSADPDQSAPCFAQSSVKMKINNAIPLPFEQLYSSSVTRKLAFRVSDKVDPICYGGQLEN